MPVGIQYARERRGQTEIVLWCRMDCQRRQVHRSVDWLRRSISNGVFIRAINFLSVVMQCGSANAIPLATASSHNFGSDISGYGFAIAGVFRQLFGREKRDSSDNS